MHIFLLRGVLLILITGLIGGNMYGLVAGPNINVLRTDNAYYLKTYEQQTDDNLRSLYPDPAAVREMAPILKKYELNVFSNDHINHNETNGSSNESIVQHPKIDTIIIDMHRSINEANK